MSQRIHTGIAGTPFSFHGQPIGAKGKEIIMSGALTGTLIDELFKRYPDLVGPLKDEIEQRNLRNERRDN